MTDLPELAALREQRERRDGPVHPRLHAPEQEIAGIVAAAPPQVRALGDRPMQR